ncbi:hypothetical protein BJV78DRAFT_1202321 [Lactifluus subvellereus]|nr:hypothetical protein BJV78DRAFT_1202321 [Lactifluus subvellereus]
MSSLLVHLTTVPANVTLLIFTHPAGTCSPHGIVPPPARVENKSLSLRRDSRSHPLGKQTHKRGAPVKRSTP